MELGELSEPPARESRAQTPPSESGVWARDYLLSWTDPRKWAVSEFLSDAPFLDLVSGQSWRWQTVHVRVGWVIWWTSTSFTFHRVVDCTLWTRGAYCVPEVFNTLTETYTQGHVWLFCMLIPCVYIAKDYKLKLKFLNKSWVHTTVQFSL